MSVICWSYTLMIACVAMLFWLEITVFQIYTLVSFIVFAAVGAWQLWARQIKKTPTHLIFQAVVRFNTKRVPLDEIQAIAYRRHQLVLTTTRKTWHFMMTRKTYERVSTLIQAID